MHARVSKLEAVISTLATREDLVRLELTIHREVANIHQIISAQTWKILSSLIATSTTLVAVTFYLVKHVG